MRLYTKEIDQYIDTRDWPKRLLYKIEEHQITDDAYILSTVSHPMYLQFVLFRANFDSLDGEDRLQTYTTVREVMMKLRKDGIPIYLEVR